MPETIELVVESPNSAPYVAGAIRAFCNQPVGKTGGDFYGIPVRFHWENGELTRVIVRARGDAIRLLAALYPKPPADKESAQ